jgi:3-oxoacyl-[acyl-carrier protein] reductase
MNWDNKVALVTGSSRGIGRAIALKLAEKGCQLALNFLSNRQAADQVADRIKKMGRKAVLFPGDVSDFSEAEGMIRKVKSELGRIDILVNNVGPFLYKSIFDTTIQEWRDTQNSNLNSVFYCCKTVVPVMREQKSGVIINIGAPNAERTQGYIRNCAYATAKTGVVVFTKSLAKEEAKNGIRVNVVNPGFVETDNYTDEDREHWSKEIPLRRMGTPEELANAVAFLCSDEASYITGSVLNVHGGLWC